MPRGVPTHAARWWYVRLNRQDHPWVFEGGEPYRKIAALELIATLLSEVAFGKDRAGVTRMRLVGTTDNLGNQGAIRKLMTSSFPLCTALMELASRQAQSGTEMVLRWAPREQNVEADELSNGIFHRFRPELRVAIACDRTTLPVMHEMLDYGRDLYRNIQESKERRGLEVHALTGGNSSKRGRGLKETDPW